MFGLVLARPSPNKLICLFAVFFIRCEVETKYFIISIGTYKKIDKGNTVNTAGKFRKMMVLNGIGMNSNFPSQF